MELTRHFRIRAGFPAVMAAAAGWMAAYVATRLGLRHLPSGSSEAVAIAALVPTLAFFVFVGTVQRAVRRADELQRVIQLDALAFAFSTTICVLMGLGLVDLAHGGRLAFPPLADWWILLPLLYAVCLAMAQRRYR